MNLSRISEGSERSRKLAEWWVEYGESHPTYTIEDAHEELQALLDKAEELGLELAQGEHGILVIDRPRH